MPKNAQNFFFKVLKNAYKTDVLVYIFLSVCCCIDFIPGGYRYMGHNKYAFLGTSCVSCWRKSHNKPCAHEKSPNHKYFFN